VEPVTAAAAGLGGHVTETTVGLAVNKDKMLEAYTLFLLLFRFYSQ
jgi:acyl CoA:acetate/3-ketoacid CoA transferase alpha subunit